MKRITGHVLFFALLFHTAQASESPTVRVDPDSFSFVAITVPDITSSATWYREHFGLSERFSYASDDKSVQILVLSGPGLEIELQQHSAALPLHPPEGKAFLRHGVFKFGARVVDVRSAVKGLEAAGTRVVVAPFEDRDGHYISAVVSDNSGNWVQLFQPLGERSE